MFFVNSMAYKARLKIDRFQGLDRVSGLSGDGCVVQGRLQASYSPTLEMRGRSHASSALVKECEHIYQCSWLFVCALESQCVFMMERSTRSVP